MVFVTGATGLLGSHLLYYLAGSGKKVCALKRKSSRLEDVQEVWRQYAGEGIAWEGIEWIEGDVAVPETMEAAISRADCVYHCAAVVSFDGDDKNYLLNVNLQGTENVAALCRKYKVRMCYVSSIAALGDPHFEGEIVDEDTSVIEDRIHSVYSQSKFTAEGIVWDHIRKGLEAVIVNPSIILGAGHWDRSSSRLFVTASKGIPFYTEGVCGYVDVRDVCRLMLRLSDDRQIRGERFVVNGGNYSYRELFTEIARAAGHRPPIICLYPWMAAAIWRLLAVAGKITGKKPAFTRETARASLHKSYYSSAKLLSRYPDYRFYSLNETIGEIHAAYRETEDRQTENYTSR